MARWAHAAAAVGSLLFAYGGVGQVVLDDLVVLDVDLMTWRTLKPRAAGPRDRPGKLHAAAMAPIGHVLWLFGGQQGRKFLRELFSLDTNSMTWALAAPGGGAPAARAGHTLTAVDGVGIFLFGGQGKKLYDDLHVLVVPQHQHQHHHPAGARPDDSLSACSTSSAGSSGAGSGVSGASSAGGPSSAPVCEWVGLKARGRGPSARRGHTLTWDGRDSLILFGGSTSSSTDNGLWVYSVSQREWTEIKARGAVPTPRTHHSAVLLRPGKLLVFGGCNAQGVFFQDAYILDLSAYMWSRPITLGALPAARYHHSCTPVGRRIVLYGGINPRQAFEGVVLVESGSSIGGGELSAVADELCRMSISSAASDGGASQIGQSAGVSVYGGNGTGANGNGGGSLHGSSLYGNPREGGAAAAGAVRAPSAPPSLVGSALAAGDLLNGLLAGDEVMGGYGGYRSRDGNGNGGGGNGNGDAANGGARSVASGSTSVAAGPAGAGASAGGAAPAAALLSGDLMKLQLRDLLVKRHLEDLQLSTTKKAEELAAALDAERESRAGVERELIQARLVCAEAEERARREARRADDASARAVREGAEAEAARAAAAGAAAAQGALERQLAEANRLLDSISRELGLLSSRHHRLQLEYTALQRSHARTRAREREREARLAQQQQGQQQAAAGGGTGAGGSGSDEEDEDNGGYESASSGSCPTSGDDMAMTAAGTAGLGSPGGSSSAATSGACPHAQLPAECLLCAVQRYLAATQQLLATGSTAAATQQLLAAGSTPMAAAAGAVPLIPPQSPPHATPSWDAPCSSGGSSSVTELRKQLADARAALAASESARAAAQREATALASAAADAAADAGELRTALARMGGDRLALAACSAGELRELEARLDAAARTVRDLVVERTVSELQRRSSAEGTLCTVCMERRKGLVFNCGHQTCVECGEQLKTCAFCRQEVTTKIRLWQS